MKPRQPGAVDNSQLMFSVPIPAELFLEDESESVDAPASSFGRGFFMRPAQRASHLTR